MKIVKFDKQVVSVGLNWHWVEEDNNRKALVKALKDEISFGASSGAKDNEVKESIKKACILRYIDMASVGFWVESSKGVRGGLGPAGAGLLALANQERINASSSAQSSGLEDDVWLLIETLSEDEYWIVFVNKGLPMPGGDIITSLEGVRSFLGQDALQEMPLKLFTTDLNVQDYAPPKAQVVSQGFVELIKNIKPSKAQLKPVSGIDPIVVAIILGFVLIVAGFFGWSWYDKNQKQKAAAASAAQQAQAQSAQFEAEKRGYVESVQQAVLTALDQGVASVDGALSSPATKEVINAWLELVGSIPLEHSGFNATRAECVLEGEEPVCTVHLTRGDWGINRIFLQDYPQATLVGNDATYVLRGPPLIKREANWKTLPSADRFNVGLVSDLQIISKAGVSFNQTASQDIVQKIEMPAPPANVLSRMDPNAVNIPPSPVNLGVAKGQLSLSGSGLWQAEGFNVTLDRPGLGAMTFNVTLPAQTWQMQLNYFIRTLPSPQLPVVLGPDGPINTPFPEKYRHLTAGEATGGLAEVAIEVPEEKVEEVSETAPVDEDIQIGLPDAPASTAPLPNQ